MRRRIKFFEGVDFPGLNYAPFGKEKCVKIDKYLDRIKDILSDFTLNFKAITTSFNSARKGFVVEEKNGSVWYSEHEYNKYEYEHGLDKFKKYESLCIVIKLNSNIDPVKQPHRLGQNKPSVLSSFTKTDVQLSGNILYDNSDFLEVYQILAASLDRISDLGFKYFAGNSTFRGGNIFELIIYLPE